MKPITEFLKTITPPRIIRESMALYGTTETAGLKSNPIILNWAKETKIKDDDWYQDDSTPWCGLFAAVVVQRAGWEIPKQPLRALSWANFGSNVDKDKAVLGDVLVFSRKGGGHVGFYVAEDKDNFYVLGGNQSDKVNISKIQKSRTHAVRRPLYRIAMPESCKKYYFSINSPISTNES